MIHDLIAFLREAFRPQSNRPTSPEIRRSRELVTESNIRRDRGEQLIRRVEEDQENDRFARLGAVRDLIRSDDIAPLPRIWSDDTGRGR